jgi:cyclophilin family peptidyl-prolyl cis-trans isomerase
MRLDIAFPRSIAISACPSAPPAPRSAPRPPAAADAAVSGPTYEQKMAAILRLEDQRVLGEPPFDLPTFAADRDARVRRRAALAIGRSRLRDGLRPLVARLGDSEPEVRQIAAFALGLLGEAGAKPALTAALDDQALIVEGSAAEALGLLGDPASAPDIGRMLKRLAQSGALAAPPRDEDDVMRDTPTAVVRLGLFALARLKAYDELAALVLDEGGQPKIRWWPVAYALQRCEDPRAFAALMTLAADPHPYTRGFAVKGLGPLKNPAAVPLLLPLAAAGRGSLAVEAVRSLGRIGDAAAVPVLSKLVETMETEPQVRLEAVVALGGIRAPGVVELLLDLFSHPSPTMRAAALRSAAAADPEGFVAVLSGLDPDQNWTVRTTMADVLGSLPQEAALPRLNAMLSDGDQRVIPTVIRSLVRQKAPLAEAILLSRLTADDAVVRAAAAEGLGEMKFPSGVRALENAYATAQRDAGYTARAAIVDAIAKYGLPAARVVLTAALTDRDWTVRVRAAALYKQLDPGSADLVDRQTRPAPVMQLPNAYQNDRFIRPATAPQAFIETDRGTVQIELAPVDAPLTVENFVALARRGFFEGLSIHRVVPDFVVQAGDPRGDGEGGPGFTIRDELNQRPYLRGTIGMALESWPDSGASQFFITHSPQPHLDAKYTAFGVVVGGMEVVDRLEQWDIIRHVRVSDGSEGTGNAPVAR